MVCSRWVRGGRSAYQHLPSPGGMPFHLPAHPPRPLHHSTQACSSCTSCCGLPRAIGPPPPLRHARARRRRVERQLAVSCLRHVHSSSPSCAELQGAPQVRHAPGWRNTKPAWGGVQQPSIAAGNPSLELSSPAHSTSTAGPCWLPQMSAASAPRTPGRHGGTQPARVGGRQAAAAGRRRQAAATAAAAVAPLCVAPVWAAAAPVF